MGRDLVERNQRGEILVDKAGANVPGILQQETVRIHYISR